jgi:hypothetical protein
LHPQAAKKIGEGLVRQVAISGGKKPENHHHLNQQFSEGKQG